MAKKEAFVIPVGLKFEQGPDGLVIENEGDIQIHGTLGSRLARLSSTSGDVVLHVEADVGEIDAPAGAVTAHRRVKANRISARSVTLNGDANVGDVLAPDGSVDVHGALEAQSVRAAAVSFSGSTLSARVVAGSRSVAVGAVRIHADLLIAPAVTLASGASGKVTVVESHNDLGSHAVRGCLRLADLEDFGGNAETFLAERGVSRLGPPGSAPETAPPAPEPAVTTRTRSLGEVEMDTIVEEDSSEVQPVAAHTPDDPVHQQVVETLDRIVQCYADGELPPAISDLRDWVNRKDYGTIRDGITNVWNQLLNFHKAKGMRMLPQVTTNFNALNSIVRKL